MWRPPISSGATGAVHAGRGCMTTRRAVMSDAHGHAALRLDGLRPPAVFDGPNRDTDVPRLRGTSPGAAPAMWSCSITSPCTSSRTSEMRLQPSARACAVSAALQSRLQSDRAAVRETQSILRARAPAQLRSCSGLMRASIALFTADEAPATCATPATASLPPNGRRSGSRASGSDARVRLGP